MASTVKVQSWGAGGGGAASNAQGEQTGGGGGAYSETTAIEVVVGSYTVTVGVGGTTDADGGDSGFDDNSENLAKGGRQGSVGTGGAAASGVGDIKFSGGNGAVNRDNDVNVSRGGGGGGAGTTENGSNGVKPTTTDGGAGGAGGTLDGGAGGRGSDYNSGTGGPGETGNTIGGGGGGASAGETSAGARGEVRVSYPTGTVIATGGTKNEAGGIITHTFTTTGIFEVTVVAIDQTDTLALTETSLLDFGVFIVETLGLAEATDILFSKWRNLTKSVSSWINKNKN